jgi:allantoinase
VIIRSRRVVLPEDVRPATIHIQDGTIARIGPYEDWSGVNDSYDAGDLVVSPGIVDTHVHINEPGRTDWEGFDTGDAGGRGRWRDDGRRHAAEQRAGDDDGSGARGEADGSARPVSRRRRVLGRRRAWQRHGPRRLVEAGVRGFKCFLVPSGVDEFPAVDERDLREALPILSGRRSTARPCEALARIQSHAERESLSASDIRDVISPRVRPRRRSTRFG